jgi:FkbM family methyltransferase
MTTSELLSETVDAARRRETTAFDGLEADAGGKIVLFGAGRLGRKVLAALRRQGIEPLSFADNDPKLQGTKVDGVSVLLPLTAAQRWRDEAMFVVATFLPSGGGILARLRELQGLGCQKVTSYLPLGWKCNGVLPHFAADLPSRLLGHSRELEGAGELWSDDISRETFMRQLTWRLRADFEEAVPPAPDQYFPQDILRPNPDESFIDGGAFVGDTLRAAPWKFSRILAIEPDPANAAKLRSLSSREVRLREVLLGCAAGSARFNGSGTMAAARSDTGDLTVSVATLDELAAGENPTFIKLDVEGDELAALQGGLETLKRSQPVVAACVYHRPADLWTIPLFLHEALPAHRMFLRVHAWDGFELVAYAVPPERCLQLQ